MSKIKITNTRTRHIATIATALDRADASRHGSVVITVGSVIIDHGECCDRFEWGGWTPKQIRAAVLAYASHAPSGELAEMAATARREIRWVEHWDLAGHDEGHLVPSLEVLLLPEREARRAEAVAS